MIFGVTGIIPYLVLCRSPKNYCFFRLRFAARVLSEMSAIVFLTFNSSFATNVPAADRCNASVWGRRMPEINIFVCGILLPQSGTFGAVRSNRQQRRCCKSQGKRRQTASFARGGEWLPQTKKTMYFSSGALHRTRYGVIPVIWIQMIKRLP